MRKLILIYLTLGCISHSIGQMPGMALVLDGEDDFMKAQGTVFSNMDSLTISAWIKSFSNGAIVTNHSHGVYWESVELLVNWFIVNWANDQSTRQLLNFPAINDSSWHHFAAVWDGSEMRIYLDGLAYGDSISAPSVPWNSSAPITVGARESFVSPLASAEFTGKIDELRIWSTVRSQQQIQKAMHTTLGSNYCSTLDSGLIAYWRFDELEDLGVGGDGADDIRDFSANQLHADLVGDATLDTSSVVLGIPLEQNNSIKTVRLFQNYPNPFNPVTVISWQLAFSSHVDLEIFNLQGQKIRTLLSGSLFSGFHSVEFDASGLASGLYFYRLQAGRFIEIRKMIVLK